MRAPALLCLVLALSAAAQAPFRVQVVDGATGRGVPLVELETVNHVRWVTDSAGLAAIDEPGLFGERVWFTVRSHGYEVPADGFGNRGFACRVEPGGAHTVRIQRVQVAERLYRVTGAGIYRDSVLLGDPVPLAKPLLNGGVLGSDSVVNAIYHGKLWWFWGDTNRAAYPLGNFAVTGATSRLPADGGLAPDVGVDLEYFTGEDGFARRMCPIEGPGPVWIFGLMVVQDAGRERMLTHYARIKTLGEAYEQGIAEWNDGSERFEVAVRFPLETRRHPTGNPLRVRDGDGEWFVFTTPYPTLRVPARAEAILDHEAYQAFAPGGAGGAGAWAWRAGVEPPTPEEVRALPAGGRWQDLRDVESGEPIRGHGGTVCWNAHRGRWIMIALEGFGRSMLGEVWFAEADTLAGPWCWARRIVTHDDYSFYNVKQHPYFDGDGGRLVYFEGTYTATFSGNTHPTPRYDYNQVLYRLDLDDPRLVLPRPVYRVRVGGASEWLSGDAVAARGLWDAVEEVPFHALAPGAPGAVPVEGTGFAVLAPEGVAPAACVPLSRWRRGAERTLHAGDGGPPGEGWSPDGGVLGRVWPAPSPHPPLTPGIR